MNFQHLDHLPFLILGLFVFIVAIIWLEIKFFSMVRLYWFYKRSFFSYLSTFLLIIGFSLLVLSLLDLRGPEEKIKAGVPTERTIILIDTSASMLAEDVKPSRLQKAVLVAKHFARKAAGQQLSIVAFAEIQKKIVPFTNDLDLIDARLESIKNLRNQNGSSALSVAIQESIQYFKETGDARGNLLVLTDGEETAEDIKLNMPKDIHLALVGVGTTQGGRIPLDDGHGFRFGYKKNKGLDVITKLHEGFFKKIVSDVPSGEYWLANTYNFPTDEILEFFKAEKSKGDKQQDMVVRPVLMEYLVVPALILLILAYFFKSIKVFSLGLLLVILPVQAEENVELSPEIISQMDHLKNGDLNQLQKVKLADDLLKAGATDEALALYEENLPSLGRDQIPPEAYLNYGTGLLQKGEAQEGFEVYDKLLNSLPANSEKKKQIKDMIEKNVLSFFKTQKQKQDQQKKEQQDKQNQKQNQSGEGSSQNSSGQQQQNKQQNPQNSDQKDQNKKDKSEKEKDQKDKNSDEAENNDRPKEKPENQEGPKKPLPPQKLEPKLKQLMSDDRQLQLKIIEQGTREMNRRKNRDNKDW